jgi:hypothetical protein
VPSGTLRTKGVTTSPTTTSVRARSPPLRRRATALGGRRLGAADANSRLCGSPWSGRSRARTGDLLLVRPGRHARRPTTIDAKFIVCNREQDLLLRPAPEWLPRDDPARFVLEAVEDGPHGALGRAVAMTARGVRPTTPRRSSSAPTPPCPPRSLRTSAARPRWPARRRPVSPTKNWHLQPSAESSLGCDAASPAGSRPTSRRVPTSFKEMAGPPIRASGSASTQASPEDRSRSLSVLNPSASSRADGAC